MKPFSSLFAKIMFQFFLNLLLVTLILGAFFMFQTQADFYALFGRRSFHRMVVAAELVCHDLNQTTRVDWPEVLSRHSGLYQVHFALILEDGTRFLSNDMELPEKVIKPVLNELRDEFPPHGPPREGNAPRLALRPPPPAGPFDLNAPWNKPRSQPGTDLFHGKNPLRMARTLHPTRYWVHIPFPMVIGSSQEGPATRALLLAVSDSITGNGFFFDPIPWLMALAAVLLISILLWMPLVKRITRPIMRMTHAAEEIAKGRFDVRVEDKRRDEIGRLGIAINNMTARLSALMKGQKRFLGDVAHELGSPVARIQIGLGILEQRVLPEQRHQVADVMEDVAQMSTLVSELLSFSRAEVNSVKVELAATALLPLARGAVEREGCAGTDVILRITPDIRVIACPELLARALSNLIRNAIRYAGAAGPIYLSAETAKDQVIIEVKDQGPGVPAVLLDQIFEPFFRPEPSRDRHSGGVGLGLAIVKTCVEACKGTVSARNLNPTGFAVTLTLNA